MSYATDHPPAAGVAYVVPIRISGIGSFVLTWTVALATVVDAHRGARPWLTTTVEQMARTIATRLVLERLPEELGEIASEFESVVR